MTTEMEDAERRDWVADPGSFRDRSNRVYRVGGEVLRGVDARALQHWKDLVKCGLAEELQSEGKIVRTELAAAKPTDLSWAGYLSHDPIPFISYPYEWSFGMLQDAALLHLEILEKSIPRGWTLKDASAYNVQWKNCRPIFIDVPSFEPYKAGEAWNGYRQFCMMFLNPLMLKAYKDIDFGVFLRSDLEGVDPSLAAKILSDAKFKNGVFGHVHLHARMQERAAARELAEAKQLTETSGRDVAARKPVRHSLAMVLGVIDQLKRIVGKLRIPEAQTTWGAYDTNHSYSDASFAAKMAFVEKHASARRRTEVWDLGCNTGMFSRACEPHADRVISVDGDAKAINRLYHHEKSRIESKLLPLIINLGNVSPNQGWRGRERLALERRGRPELILCLALIHHIVISANVPMHEFIDWLHDLGGDVIIEFVTAEDDMSRMLLRNKVNQYQDYTIENFERVAGEKFRIADSEELKGGRRKIYFLSRA